MTAIFERQQCGNFPFFPDAAFDIVTIAASLGGFQALRIILGQLPESFPGAVILAQHRSPQRPSFLSELLSRYCRLTVKEAVEGERLLASTVYLAEPGFDFELTPEFTLSHTGSRRGQTPMPCADMLFRSVAHVCGNRAIGVVLTGSGNDGMEGVKRIKKMGGRIIVQDKGSSEAFGMPGSAISTGCVDFVLPLRSIASALTAMVMVKGAAQLFEVPMPHWALLPE